MKPPRGDVADYIRLVGEIDPGLDQRQRLDQLLPPGLGTIAEQSLQLPHRLPALRLRVGIDQIGQPFDCGQVELAVLEGAAGEFPRLRRPHSWHPRQRLEYRRR